MSDILETTATIAVDGGTMTGFMAAPATGKAPGIVMLQEIFGVNEAMRSKAREFAREGFAVLVPDLFWRQEPGVQLGYDPEGRAKGFALFNAFDFPKGIADIRAAFAHLAADAHCDGSAALVGFCLGGKLAVVAGSAEPKAKAVVAFYGVKLDDNLAQLKAMGMPVMLHFGTEDTHIPNEVSQGLKDALAGKDGASVHIYQGAQHGFFNSVRAEVYDDAAATQAMQRTLDLLRAA